MGLRRRLDDGQVEAAQAWTLELDKVGRTAAPVCREPGAVMENLRLLVPAEDAIAQEAGAASKGIAFFQIGECNWDSSFALGFKLLLELDGEDLLLRIDVYEDRYCLVQSSDTATPVRLEGPVVSNSMTSDDEERLSWKASRCSSPTGAKYKLRAMSLVYKYKPEFSPRPTLKVVSHSCLVHAGMCLDPENVTQVQYSSYLYTKESRFCQAFRIGNSTFKFVRGFCDEDEDRDLFAPSTVEIYEDPLCKISSSLAMCNASDACLNFAVGGGFLQLACLRNEAAPFFHTSPPENGPNLRTILPSTVGPLLLILLSGIVFLIMTRRGKSKDRLEEDAESEDTPTGVSTVARFSVFGISVRLAKSKETKRISSSSVSIASWRNEGNAISKLDKDLIIRDRNELKPGDLIGKGAFTRVREGRFRGSSVALKEFHSNHDAFAREIQSLVDLRHPNIIRLHGVFFEDPTRILVLEKAAVSLDALTEKRAPLASDVTIVAILQWLQQVCGGCQFIHSKGIVHFDLKPANILLSAGWTVKIADFGSSFKLKDLKRLGEQDGDSDTIVTHGSPAFIAPEVSNTSCETWTTAADVYSFAMVFWCMLHRKEPFNSKWPGPRVVCEVADNNLRPMIDDEIPAHIAELILHCWSADPDQRLAFSDLMEEFDIILGPSSVSSSSSVGSRPRFELGQDVHVWNPRKMQFIGSGKIRAAGKTSGPPYEVAVTSQLVSVSGENLVSF